MASKLLVFVMLYIMVDVSLVLGYTGDFKVTRKRTCTWTTDADDDFTVLCEEEGKADVTCKYTPSRAPNDCGNKGDYFANLANDLKQKCTNHGWSNIVCKDGKTLSNRHTCRSIIYSPPPGDYLFWDEY